MSVGIFVAITTYSQGRSVAQTARHLLSQDLPTFAALDDVVGDLIEYERYLYEYYAKPEAQDAILNEIQQLDSRLDAAQRVFKGNLPQQLLAELELFRRQSNQLTQRMIANLSGDTDWDLARSLLEQHSQIRRGFQQQLADYYNTLERQVAESSQQSIDNTQHIITLVISSSIFYLLASAALGYYTFINHVESRERLRLSTFAQRNPNPIITLNWDGGVDYYNPATEEMLNLLGKPIDYPEVLLPDNIELLLNSIKQSNDQNINVRQAIDGKTMAVNIHVINELKLFHVYVQDISKAVEAEHKLTYLAKHDKLTQLPNRYEFEHKLQKKLRSTEQQVVVGLISLDRFSRVTSSLGYEIGDMLISNAALLIMTAIYRNHVSIPNAKLYRFSGTTFAFYSFVDNLTQVNACINSIEQAVEEEFKHPLHVVDNDFYLTASIGVSVFPKHGIKVNDLIKNAEAALQKSQQKGGSQLTRYSEEYRLKEQLWFNLETQLRKGIKRGELLLHYQPKWSLLENRCKSAEALIRWQQEHKMVSPAEFIPVAEQTGLIVAIGEWVFSEAARQVKTWRAQGHDIMVAVNISPRQFQHKDFLATIQRVVETLDVPPNCLELEITEGVVMENVEYSIKVMQQLKLAGFYLSMDDFGTGYSSLSYLKRFPIDRLKIDMSFVRNMLHSDREKAIVKTIIDLAHNLNLSVIAEGVETEQQMQELAKMGCETIQGYFISKPLAVNELEQTDFLG